MKIQLGQPDTMGTAALQSEDSDSNATLMFSAFFPIPELPEKPQLVAYEMRVIPDSDAIDSTLKIQPDWARGEQFMDIILYSSNIGMQASRTAAQDQIPIPTLEAISPRESSLTVLPRQPNEPILQELSVPLDLEHTDMLPVSESVLKINTNDELNSMISGSYDGTTDGLLTKRTDASSALEYSLSDSRPLNMLDKNVDDKKDADSFKNSTHSEKTILMANELLPTKNVFVRESNELKSKVPTSVESDTIKPTLISPLVKNGDENKPISIAATQFDGEPVKQDTESFHTVFHTVTDFFNKKFELQDPLINRNMANQSFLDEGLYSKQEQKPIYPTLQFNANEVLYLKMDTYSAKLKVHPQDLGEITAEISVNKGVAELRLQADNQSVKHFIETNLQELKDSFLNSNMQLDHISVQNNLMNDKNNFNQQRRSLAAFDEVAVDDAEVGAEQSKTTHKPQSDLIIDTYA